MRRTAAVGNIHRIKPEWRSFLRLLIFISLNDRIYLSRWSLISSGMSTVDKNRIFFT